MGENTLNTNQLLFLQIEEGGGDICQGRLIIAWMIGLYQRINKEEKLVSNKAKKAILYLILYFWEKVKNGWMIVVLKSSIISCHGDRFLKIWELFIDASYDVDFYD